MDQDFQNQEKIHQYLQGELSAEEKNQFEKELASNPNLKEEFSFSKAMLLLVKNKELVATNQQLKTIIANKPIEPDFSALEEYESSTRIDEGGKSGFSMNWILGGLVLLSLALITIFSIQNVWFDNEAIPAMVQPHLVPFENVINTDENTTLQEGMAAYTHADYDKAIEYFTNHQKESYDPNVQFYLGITQLLNKNPQKAVPTLERAVDSTAPPVQEAAQWYLALAYISNDQIPAAKSVLQTLQYNPIYENKATEMLQELEDTMIQ